MAVRNAYETPIPLSRDPAERLRFYSGEMSRLDAERNRIAAEMMIAQAELAGHRAAGISGGQLLTVPEAAERLGLGKSATYDLIANGHLPKVSLEGVNAVRIEARSVDEYVARSKRR